MPPEDTLWPLEPHTLGKHRVLREYLNAWLPILGTSRKRILFIDGFAGPGEYQGGEEGSPIIALRALAEHSAREKISAEVVYRFIEKDAGRAQHLESLVDEMGPRLPDNCHVDVINGLFDETMTGVLDQLDAQAKHLAPALVMIDPFGVSGTPMKVIERIMKNPQCEVYVSLMYESINRFLGTAEFESHLDALFGCPDWREALEFEDGEERRVFLSRVVERGRYRCPSRMR